MELLNKDIRDYKDDDIDEDESPIKDMDVFCFNDKMLRITMLTNFYNYVGVDLIDGCMQCSEFKGFDCRCDGCTSMYWGISEDLELSLLAILDDIGYDGNEFEVLLYLEEEEIMVNIYPISNVEEIHEITNNKYILKPYICQNEIWIPAIKRECLDRKRYDQ